MRLLRAAGYDLAAMGNSTAIRYGPQAVAALAERFGQPLLAGNIPDPATGRLIAGTVPMRLLTVAGVRMAFVGLTAPMGLYSFFKVKPWQPADVLPGLIAEARRLGARTIVLLSHLGARDDQALAAAVPGVDLILGGHSHTEMVPPVTVGTTLIAQAGEHGRFLGRLDLDVEHATGRLHLRVRRPAAGARGHSHRPGRAGCPGGRAAAGAGDQRPGGG